MVAPALVLAITLAGAPLAAIGGADDVIGSVSTAGSVRLRGVAVSAAGTVFSGDSIETADAAYARLAFDSGQRIELGGDTQVSVELRADGLAVGMRSGTLSFAATDSDAALNIQIENYEILPDGGSTGDVTFMAENQVGVRARTGLVRVRNVSSGELLILSQQEQAEDEDDENTQVIILDEPLDPGAIPQSEGASDDDGGISPVVLYPLIGGGAGGAILVFASKKEASPN